MSETQTEQVAVKAPVITRNEVDKTLKQQIFGKKSDNKGKMFFAPELSIGEWETDSKWVGVDWLVSVANRTMRKIFGDIYLENINKETGVLDEASWAKDAADFTAGFAKLGDLEDELQELSDQQFQLSENPSFSFDISDNPTAEAIALVEQMKAISTKIKPIRSQIAKIKADFAARVAARDAKKAAEAAKTATVQTSGV